MNEALWVSPHKPHSLGPCLFDAQGIEGGLDPGGDGGDVDCRRNMHGSIRKLGDTLFWSPYNKDPTI